MSALESALDAAADAIERAKIEVTRGRRVDSLVRLALEPHHVDLMLEALDSYATQLRQAELADAFVRVIELEKLLEAVQPRWTLAPDPPSDPPPDPAPVPEQSVLHDEEF